MRRKWLRWLVYSGYLALSAISVPLLAAHLAGASPWPGCAAVAAAALAGYAVSGGLKRRRALAALLCAAAAVAGALVLLPYGAWNALTAALCAALTIVGARHNWSDPETAVVDVRLTAAGVIASMAVYLIALLNQFDALKAPVGYAAYAHLMLSALLINRKTVRLNAGGQARRMMRGNQALTWGFMAAVTLAVFFERLQRAVGDGLRWLVSSLLNLFAGDPAPAANSGGGGAMGPMDLGALGGQDAQWPPWLQTLGSIVLGAVTAAALLGLGVFLAVSLWKAGRALAAWVRQWLQRFDPGAGEDYSEESEQMMSAQSMRRQLGEDIRHRLRRAFERPPRWSAMTPAQRVRWTYGQLLRAQRRRGAAADALTPQELCAQAQADEGFAALYDRVRYGDGQAQEQEAERYRALSRR